MHRWQLGPRVAGVPSPPPWAEAPPLSSFQLCLEAGPQLRGFPLLMEPGRRHRVWEDCSQIRVHAGETVLCARHSRAKGGPGPGWQHQSRGVR